MDELHAALCWISRGASVTKGEGTIVAVSRATLEKITAFKRRMGWRFEWVSSLGGDFNYDFHVSFTPEELARGEVFYNYTRQRMDNEEMTGLSVFCKDQHGDVFHTYSQYARCRRHVSGCVSFPRHHAERAERDGQRQPDRLGAPSRSIW
jgi:predicted dithiol-disulfide oxidoreductase (DUF899 family)